MTVRKHLHDSFGCVCKTEHKFSKKYSLAKSNKYKEAVLALAVHRRSLTTGDSFCDALVNDSERSRTGGVGSLV